MLVRHEEQNKTGVLHVHMYTVFNLRLKTKKVAKGRKVYEDIELKAILKEQRTLSLEVTQ